MKNNVLAPDWILRLRAAGDLSEAQDEAARERQRADLLTVKVEGPIFWQSLLKELKLATDSLPQIGAHGSVSVGGEPSDSCAPPAPQQCRILVRSKSILPRQTYVDLYYSCGDVAIKGLTLNGEMLALEFSICPEGTVKVLGDDGWRNPEQAAEFLLKRLLRQVGVKF